MRSSLILALCLAAATVTPAQPPQTAPAQGPRMAFSADARTGLIYFTVREDAAADFESLLPRLRDALAQSDQAERRKQAAGWKVYRLPPANGVVVFVAIVDPVVPNADYDLARILADAFPGEAAAMAAKLRAVQSVNMTETAKVVDMSVTGAGFHVVPPPPIGDQPLRVGGDIKEPKLLSRVNPIYPADALQQKIQGNVYIEAIIGKDGSVRTARVVGGKDELADAALEAVKQWKYSPTLLGGAPVEVALYVTVVFQIS